VTIRAILFDLGNTVLEYSLTGHWREFLRQRLAQIWREAVHGDTRSFASPFAKATGDRTFGMTPTPEATGFSHTLYDFFTTRFMPQIGHLPGLADLTCGCMGQV
jgi:hypothetical protein